MTNSNSLFSSRTIDRRFHTPRTYRTQRRLQFSSSTLTSQHEDQRRLTAGARDLAALHNFANDLDNVGNVNSPTDDSEELHQASATNNTTAPTHPLQSIGSSPFVPPAQLPSFVPSTQFPIQNADDSQLTLPWDINGNKHTKLYAIAPPKLAYPAGSRDESMNHRFIKRMDMYLNRNFLVRSILNGTTPHPFSTYKRLKEYWTAMGLHRKVFNPRETFATLDEIGNNGHAAFHQELTELLWFGGVVSYGNVMAETYAIIYGWISADDLPDLEGLCESNDGVTFRNVVINSLRVFRVRHTQAIINDLYNQLDSVKIVLRPGGMAGYFAQIKTLKMRMIKAGENLTDAYMIRRATLAAEEKHQKLDDCLADLRTAAGRTGIPTTFTDMQDALIDTFDFEIPHAEKTEEPPKIRANFANNYGRKRGNDGDDGGRRKHKKYPKGSCTKCPEATNHTTEFCWKTLRERKGLPKFFQWCTIHKRGVHYEHLCRRHAPNYPPVPGSFCPTVKGASAKTSLLSAEQEQKVDKLLAMFASNSNQTTNGIVIKRPENQQNFRTACNVPTNVANEGPQVDQIAQNILDLSPELRDELQTKLASAGL